MKNTLKTRAKEIYKHYKKSLNRLMKSDPAAVISPIFYLKRHLQYVRDQMILYCPDEDWQKHPEIVSICAAIKELDEYYLCLEKIIRLCGVGYTSADEPVAEDTTEEAKKINEERQQHWQAFWALCAINSKDWANKYASTV